MRFALLHIFIFTALISFNAKAVDYPEPKSFNVINSKDYYKDSYGYNMQKPCTGMMCIPAGSQVGCSSYDYYSHKKVSGVQLQVCNISTITNKDKNVSMDVSGEDYRIVTGIIRDGKISYNMPYGEVYIATFWRTLEYKKLELPTPLDESEAGVCLPGMPCFTENYCKEKGITNNILCLKSTVEKTQLPKPLPEIENNYAKPSNYKEIGKAFKIGNGSTSFAPTCSNFIDKNGNLGVRGKKVLDAIKKAGPDWFYGGPDCCKTKARIWDPYSGKESSAKPKQIDVSSVCPKFKNFTRQQKEYFWVWTFAAMANDESTCGQRSDNPRNPRTCGLMQLEKNRKRNRDRVLCNPQANCRSNETFQMECSASILRDFSARFNFSLTAPGSYWEKLRGNKSVARHIRQYPGCN